MWSYWEGGLKKGGHIARLDFMSFLYLLLRNVTLTLVFEWCCERTPKVPIS